MKSFLIPIGGSVTDEALFATALATARPFLSHLNFPFVKNIRGRFLEPEVCRACDIARF
jgi:hypothetical protein